MKRFSKLSKANSGRLYGPDRMPLAERVLNVPHDTDRPIDIARALGDERLTLRGRYDIVRAVFLGDVHLRAFSLAGMNVLKAYSGVLKAVPRMRLPDPYLDLPDFDESGDVDCYEPRNVGHLGVGSDSHYAE